MVDHGPIVDAAGVLGEPFGTGDKSVRHDLAVDELLHDLVRLGVPIETGSRLEELDGVSPNSSGD